MRKRNVNRRTITDVEVSSFMKVWMKNTNETINVAGMDIEQEYLYPVFTDVIKAFLANRETNRIFGVDVMNGFLINIADKNDVETVCKDIWTNPEKYYKLDKDAGTDYYSSFIKYLWVSVGNGPELRVADIANPLLDVKNLIWK